MLRKKLPRAQSELYREIPLIEFAKKFHKVGTHHILSEKVDEKKYLTILSECNDLFELSLNLTPGIRGYDTLRETFRSPPQTPPNRLKQPTIGLEQVCGRPGRPEPRLGGTTV